MVSGCDRSDWWPDNPAYYVAIMTQKYILPPAISLLAGGPPLPSSPLLLHLHAQEQLKHQPRQQSRGLDYTWQNMRGISAGELFLNVVSATDNLP